MAIETTERDEKTLTTEKVIQILAPIKGKPMLTPKEANQLTYMLTEMLMSGNCTPRCLRLLSRYLSKKAYDEIVDERVIGHTCGYPLCKYSDVKIHDIQVNRLVKSLRMPSYYKSRFCSKDHYLCSEFYKQQLSTDSLFMRVGLEKCFFSNDSIECQVVLLDEYLINGRNDDLSNVITTLRSLNVDDSVQSHTNDLISQFQDIRVIEHSGPHKSNDECV